MLGGDVLVLELLRLVLGGVENLETALREVAAFASVDLRHLAQLVVDAGLHELRVGADALEQRGDQTVLLGEQRGEHVLGQDLLLIAAARDGLRLLQRLLRLDRELVEFHGRQRNASTQRGKERQPGSGSDESLRKCEA